MDETRVRRKRRILLAGAALMGAALAGSSWMSGGKVTAAFRNVGPVTVDSRAPELIGSCADWINTGGQALKFNDPTCLLKTEGAILIDYWKSTLH